MPKIIYHYDAQTGELICAAEARESPLEEGVYLNPGFSTDLPPPEALPGHAVAFQGEAWRQVIDPRGTWYGADRQPIHIRDLLADVQGLCKAEPPSADYALTDGQWVVSSALREARIAAERDAFWETIKAERDRRIQLGGYKVGSKWFHSDTFSRTQQMGLVMLGANIPANTPWKTMDGSEITMTQALAGQIFAAAALSDITIFAVAKAHRVAMEAMADPAGYDASGGWPATFGE